MIYLELTKNISILVALCLGYSLLFRFHNRQGMVNRVTAGLVFGLGAVIAMLAPVEVAEGVIVDGRSIMLGLVGLFGGAVSALVAAALAVAYRLNEGGQGLTMGLGVILTSALLGVVFHHLSRRPAIEFHTPFLFLFGLVLHLLLLPWVLTLAGGLGSVAFRDSALPVLLLFPVGTVLIGHILATQERRRASEDALRESEDRFRAAFEATSDSILIWDRDYNYLYANQAAIDYVGATKETIIGGNLRQGLAHMPEFMNRWMRRIDGVFETGQTFHFQDQATVGGRMVHSDAILCPLYDGEGKVNAVCVVYRDVTEQRKSGAKIMGQQILLENAQEMGGFGPWIHDLQDGQMVWSENTYRLFGFSPDLELNQQMILDKVHPEDVDRVVAQWQAAQSGGDYDVEFRILVEDQEKWVWEKAEFQFDEDGTPRRAVGITQDITESRLSEITLRTSEEKFRALYDNAPLAYQSLDNDGCFLEVNPRWLQTLGYTEEEILGTYYGDLLHPQWLPHFQERFPEFKRIGSVHDVHFKIRHKDGRYLDILFEGCAGYHPDGSFRQTYCVFQDITGRRQDEEERRRLVRAIEQAAEIILITDEKANIQYVNPAFERITGYTREEVLGQNPRILKSGRHDPGFYQEMWDTLQAGESWSGHLINQTRDGRVYTEEATISPVLDDEGKITNYVAAKQDVSQEIALQEQLRQAQKMEAVGQMAGGIAHDFNNLLQVITGYVEMTRDDMQPGDTHGEALDAIGEAANRGTQLVSHLLAFSRRQVLNLTDLDLGRVLESHLNMIRSIIGENIELEFIPGHQPGTLHADQGLIEQMVTNICMNARDAMPDGGKLQIELENVLVDEEYVAINPQVEMGRYLLLSITDTGCGIQPEVIDRIFEPFFTTKDVGRGTGLGLSMVFGIVKQHQGHITVYSEPDKGTRFKIYLPTVERRATEVSREINPQPSGGTETVLVAEDDPAVLKLVLRFLRSAGYSVLETRDGQEAVEVFRQHQENKNQVILEFVMPPLGGQQALMQIQEIQPDVPHLFASGYSENAIHTDFIQKQGLNLIGKPYRREDLLLKVREILEAGEA